MNVAVQPIADPAAIAEFVARWKGNAGSERANFQSFMRELCGLLELLLPDKPADQAEAEEELLMRLVELNKQRAAEESHGKVRWLRPGYQAPDATQVSAELATEQAGNPKASAAPARARRPSPDRCPSS